MAVKEAGVEAEKGVAVKEAGVEAEKGVAVKEEGVETVAKVVEASVEEEAGKAAEERAVEKGKEGEALEAEMVEETEVVLRSYSPALLYRHSTGRYIHLNPQCTLQSMLGMKGS